MSGRPEKVASPSDRNERILIVCPMSYGPPWREGVTNLARRLAVFLKQREHQVYVLSPKGVGENGGRTTGELGEILIDVGSGGPITPRERLDFWAKGLHELKALRGSVDLVFIFASASLSFAIRTVLMRYFSGARTLVYLTAGNRMGIFRRVMAADSLAVISPYFLRWFPEASVVYPFLPIDLVGARRDENKKNKVKEEGTFHFLFLGALEQERGIETMLEGFAGAVRRSERAISLTLAWNGYGDYTPAYVRSLVSGLGIEREVRIRGLVDRFDAYNRCDAVLVPHTSETRMAFPVRILESLYMEKPLIVTDACGMGDLVDGAGAVVKRENVEEMSRAMVRLANDEEFYEGCVCRCAPLLDKYDSKKSLERLYHCIKETAA